MLYSKLKNQIWDDSKIPKNFKDEIKEENILEWIPCLQEVKYSITPKLENKILYFYEGTTFIFKEEYFIIKIKGILIKNQEKIELEGKTIEEIKELIKDFSELRINEANGLKEGGYFVNDINIENKVCIDQDENFNIQNNDNFFTIDNNENYKREFLNNNKNNFVFYQNNYLYENFYKKNDNPYFNKKFFLPQINSDTLKEVLNKNENYVLYQGTKFEIICKPNNKKILIDSKEYDYSSNFFYLIIQAPGGKGDWAETDSNGSWKKLSEYGLPFGEKITDWGAKGNYRGGKGGKSGGFCVIGLINEGQYQITTQNFIGYGGQGRIYIDYIENRESTTLLEVSSTIKQDAELWKHGFILFQSESLEGGNGGQIYYNGKLNVTSNGQPSRKWPEKNNTLNNLYNKNTIEHFNYPNNELKQEKIDSATWQVWETHVGGAPDDIAKGGIGGQSIMSSIGENGFEGYGCGGTGMQMEFSVTWSITTNRKIWLTEGKEGQGGQIWLLKDTI